MTDVFDRLELLDLDDELGDEDRLLRDTVRRFADERLRPHIRQWFEDGAQLPGARGLKAPLGCLTEARFGIIWGVTGAARDALATTLDYAVSRTQFGKPIAGLQLTRRKLAEMAVKLQRPG